MSIFQAGARAPASSTHGSGPLQPVPPALAVLFGLLLALVMSWQIVPEVWFTGNYADTDDAMRMVQVRDLLAGQGWYDLTAYRLNAPDGVFMHWSRLADLPLVALVKFFAMFTDIATAERLMRIAYPLILLAGLFTAIAMIAGTLMGRAAVAPAILLAVLQGFPVAQFRPGRIDHHSLQIVLLAFMALLAIRSLQAGRERLAGWTGVLAGISIAVSIENLVYLGVLCAAFPLMFASTGSDAARRRLLMFAIGMATSFIAAFLLTVPPSRWFVAACDAYSIAYAWPALVGGLCAGAMAVFSGSALRDRLLWAAGSGAAVAATLVLLFPQCLSGPLSAVDPYVRGFWLDNVSEARSLAVAFRLDPATVAQFQGPILLGVLLTIVALIHVRREERGKWALLLALVLGGLAPAAWQIRGFSSLAPLALFGAAWLIVLFYRWLLKRGIDTAAILCLALALPLSVNGWVASAMAWNKAASILSPPQAPAVADDADKSAGAAGKLCFANANYRPMGALSPGLVLAQIDAGAHILANSRHRVVTGAYHRNNAGNLLAIRAFEAEPEKARSMIHARGIDYVALCPGFPELKLMRKRAPRGLAAQLAGGQVPAWLVKVPLKGSKFRMFRVIKPGG